MKSDIIVVTEVNSHDWLDLCIINIEATNDEEDKNAKLRMMVDSETLYRLIKRLHGVLTYHIDKHGARKKVFAEYGIDVDKLE